MFGFIKRLLGGSDQEPAPVSVNGPVSAPRPQNGYVPPAGNTLPPAPGAAGFIAGLPTESMLYREIVVTRELQVIGYNFQLRESVLKRKEHATHTVWKLYDEVLLRNFMAEESRKAFGQKLIFLEISVWSLDSPLLRELPPAKFVLMLRHTPDLTTHVADFVEIINELKSIGFAIGFDNMPPEDELAPLVKLADFLRTQITGRDIGEISRTLSMLAHSAPEAELIVNGIHFFEELQAARQLHVTYLQGSYLRHKDAFPEADVDAGYMRLLETLNLVRAEADAAIIANSMKYDPLLSFKLLRYVNAPAAGLLTKVDTVERAVIMLGHKQLYRWLSLLLFGHERQDGTQSVLMETALIRGRMMETLGRTLFKREQVDALFTTGMFSVLDTLLRLPMASIVTKLSLPDDVAQALVRHEGAFGPLLKLVLASEEGDLPDDEHIFSDARVNRGDANRAQIEAMLWVEEVI